MVDLELKSINFLQMIEGLASEIVAAHACNANPDLPILAYGSSNDISRLKMDNMFQTSCSGDIRDMFGTCQEHTSDMY